MATITKLPSGKFRAQIRKAGVYRAHSFATKTEARAWAVAVESQLAYQVAGVAAPVPRSATLAQLIQLYRDNYAKAWGRSKDYSLQLLETELGPVALHRLSKAHIQTFIDKRAKTAGGVSIAADLSYLAGVLKYGRDVRGLALDPRMALEKRSGLAAVGISSRSRERSRVPTDAELARLYTHWATQRREIPMEEICRFALATAMRQSEITGLLSEDCNPIERTIVIRDRKDPRDKLGNDQTVPLLPDAWAIASQRLGTGRLFPYNPRSVSAAFTRGCTSCGIVDLHFHDLRHRAITELFRAGLDIPLVSILSGHKDWKQLKRYTELRAADVHRRFADMRG